MASTTSTPTATAMPSFDAITRDFAGWAAFFHKNGYIILNNALSEDMLKRLRVDLAKAQDKVKTRHGKGKEGGAGGRHVVHKRFFEQSKATVELVADSVLSDFAQYLIQHVPRVERKGDNSMTAHLIHNNAFVVPPRGRGQAPGWHTDDPLQQVIIPKGKALPEWIKLPVLVATYMIWLSDCSTPENGPTRIVPTSHRWGCVVDSEEAEKQCIAACGPAGTAVLVNSQTWHRGSENTSTVSRETLQLTYGRRIIGHKHGSIMNYVMPDHVVAGKSDATKQRFGFLEGGAYS